MKKVFFIAIAILSITIISCKKEEQKIPSETEGLKLVQTMENDSNEVEIYTKSGKLIVGYNDVFYRIKDKETNFYQEDAELDCSPVMHMMMMSHSTPKSTIEKVAGKSTLYKGFIVFIMPGNDNEKWTLSLNIESSGVMTSITDTVAVASSDVKTVTSFTGADGKKYVLALVAPEKPAIKSNDLVVGLFKRENSMSFPVVTDATILFDPRMPGMENHSSTNNVNPTFNVADNLYHGKVSLSMTGYWKLNFIVKNALNEVLKGEEVTEENESSSLFLEINF